MVVGTTSLVLHGYLHAGAQTEIDVVSLLLVLFLSLWFNFEYVLYDLDISKLL